MKTTPYDSWGAYVIGPLLVAMTIPMLLSIGRRTGTDRVIVTIMVVGLILRLGAALVRYEVAFGVYGGSADAAVYARIGSDIASTIREGSFAFELTRGIPGTGFIQLFTGLVFVLTGPTTVGGFLVFSWIAFWGLVLFYRALRISFPTGNQRRYALLVFLMPSLLFWPSSIGKESWMLFTLGLAVFGASRVFAGEKRGVVSLILGLSGMALVRPHMSVLVVVALLVALLRRRRSGSTSTGFIARVAMLVVLVGVGSVLLQQVESYFGVEEGLSQTDEVLDEAERQTSQGGSGFSAERVESVTDVPEAFLTVIFRPFPHEAHNAQALLASIEGTFLLVLFIVSAGRLLHLPRVAWREPHVLFASIYSLLFVVAFSSFGNFGIIARQRVQVLPLLFVLLALPRGGREMHANSDSRTSWEDASLSPSVGAHEPASAHLATQEEPLAAGSTSAR